MITINLQILENLNQNVNIGVYMDRVVEKFASLA